MSLTSSFSATNAMPSHQLAKHIFVQQIVFRTIQRHPGHAGSKTKLDKLEFLRVAAFGLCANFHTGTAFHDGFSFRGATDAGRI